MKMNKKKHPYNHRKKPENTERQFMIKLEFKRTNIEIEVEIKMNFSNNSNVNKNVLKIESCGFNEMVVGERHFAYPRRLPSATSNGIRIPIHDKTNIFGCPTGIASPSSQPTTCIGLLYPLDRERTHPNGCLLPQT